MSTKLSGGMAVLAAALALGIAERAEALVVADGKVYWVRDADSRGRGGAIGRANVDGSGLRPNFIRVPFRLGESGDGGLAVNRTHLFWGLNGTLRNDGRIGRARLNGSGVQPSLIRGVQPSSLDTHGAFVYWANLVDYSPARRPGSIGRALQNGRGVSRMFIRAGNSARGAGIGVDASGIYWGGGDTGGGIGGAIGGEEAPISRANLNGTGLRRTFVDTEGSVVDIDGSILYLARETGATPTGSYTEVAYVVLGGPQGPEVGPRLLQVRSGVSSFAADQGHLYWTEPANGGTRIWRAQVTSRTEPGQEGEPARTHLALAPRAQVVFVRHPLGIDVA